MKHKSTAMSKLLIDALNGTIRTFKEGAGSMPIDRWNESVFRFFYCRAIAQLSSSTKQLVECKKIDLVLHGKREKAFIEFKFYIHSRGYDPYTGKPGGMKSYPSPLNRQQFENAIEKLQGRMDEKNLSKFMVLFYADPKGCKSRTYYSDYGDTRADEKKLNIKCNSSIGPFVSGDNNCYAVIYKV